MNASKQTILPVICGGNGNIQGFLTIASTTFTGTETSFMTSDGPIAITTVTLPQKVDDGSGYGVSQFMAAVYPDSDYLTRSWIGYSAWVNTNDTGYGRSFSIPTQGYIIHYSRGVLLTNLLVNMAAQDQIPPSNLPPNVQNGTMRWVASMSVNSAQLECGFFDFPWTTLFKAKSPDNVDPLTIEVVSNPPGGAFKSTMVPNPVIAPLGGVHFNTVRIIKLGDAPAGVYVFTYKVTDTKNASTTCTLTLTLV